MATLAIESTVQAIAEANELLAAHAALILRVRSSQKQHRQQLHSVHSPPTNLLRLPFIPSPPPSPPPDDSPPSSPVTEPTIRQDLPPAKRARTARYHNYVPEEETIRNDYSQRYVDSGEWPQNWVLGAEPEHRFEEYPKQQRLLNLKKASVNQYSLPPSYLPFSELKSLHPSKFDVILLDPPFSSTFTWDHLQEINIPSLAGDPSFVFLWVGSGAGEGLERGREVLAKWGYRRCEDVVWIKTNKTTNQGPGTDPPTTSLFTRTKQHCLMGIRGTVRRSTDSWFVHCNVDTDVIIWEGDPDDPTRKPPEMYTLVENFCLGMRRLEVFGKLSSLRRGWVTALAPGQEEHLPSGGALNVEGEEGGIATRWVQESWEEGIRELANGGKPVVPMTQEIDNLRPKSPVRPGQGNTNTNTNMGGGPNNASGSGSQIMAVSMAGPNRFGSGGGGHRSSNSGFANMGNAPMNMQNQMMGQNAMMVQPMMGMTGMGPHQMGMGMGNMEELMGGWNPMMGGMGNMGVGGMGSGIPARGMNMNNAGIPGMANAAGAATGMATGHGMSGMVNSGMGMPANNAMASTMGNLPMHMMGQMGMGNAFSGQGVGVGGGNFGAGGMPMFNNNGVMNGWTGDQGQYGMDAGWGEGDPSGMMGVNIPGMVGGMNMGNMGNMPMGGMGMNQQWGGSGNF
ncbi:MT-A70-domain-containing protein [Flammula alnicola]|nr:MT-A70-domain-containing protein [Flammula alnicola]